MERREFLFTSGAAGLGFAAAANAADETKPQRDLFLMQIYHLFPGDKRKMLHAAFRDGIVPAANRAGLSPVGVFEPVHGADSLSLYALFPFKSFDEGMAAMMRTAQDPGFKAAAAPVHNSPLSDLPYGRIESSLLLAFATMPKVEIPALTTEKKSRIFEMRIYESHTQPAAVRKVEMFEKGGELAIFRKTGLQPVFFAQTLIGQRMHNLTYMLVFEDYAARERAWKAFGEDPGWVKLRQDPYYADTVSNITDIILRPTEYSQI